MARPTPQQLKEANDRAMIRAMIREQLIKETNDKIQRYIARKQFLLLVCSRAGYLPKI